MFRRPPRSPLFPYTPPFRSLAARRIDGARQFFARAYDFGYSKNIAEALRMWPRDSLLRDVLDVVRRFRPQIDRKSTRLNSSHDQISYAVFCLKKKKIMNICT